MIADMAAEIQRMAVSGRLYLYQIDLSPIGVDVQYYLTPFTQDGAEIAFEGQTYNYAAIHVTEVTLDATGEPAGPRLFLPNGNKFAASLVVSYQDFVGARVTRIKTLETFLDGGALAQANGFIARQVFVVEQKRAITPEFGEFALRPLANLDGVQLPRTTALRAYCPRRYRAYSASLGDFNYAVATCPYTGSNKFTRAGASTTDSTLDVCSKDVDGCTLRFPNAALPLWAFPGLSRVR